MTASKPPLVISYLRFSKAKQSKGDSTRRQLQASEDWAKERGLTIYENLQDHGISAYKGRNAQTGALSSLLRLIEKGKIPQGSYLLIESLDRLSREEILTALNLFLSIINAGVIIVTLQDGMEFSKENFSLPNLQYSIMVMSRAHEESATKSKRVREAWGNKRANIATKPLTRNLPYWLILDGGKIKADTVKVAAVKRMFKMAIEGYGIETISKRFNAEGIKLSRKVDYIQASLVYKTLRNRQVMGEFQLHTSEETAEGKTQRVAVGDPIPDYYPNVIDEETFYAAQAALDSRKRGGGRSSSFVNLFQGLVFDGNDASPLYVTYKSKKSGRILVSYAAKNGIKGASSYVCFPLSAFETAFMIRFGGYLAELESETDSGIGDQILAAEGRLKECSDKIESVTDEAVSQDIDARALVLLLAKMEAERQAADQRLEELKREQAYQSGNQSGVVEEYAILQEQAFTGEFDNDKRTRMRSIIARYIDRIDCKLERSGTKRKPDYTADCVMTLKDAGEINFGVRAVRDGQGGMDVEFIDEGGFSIGIRQGEGGLEMALLTK